jgi:hypothetical protein
LAITASFLAVGIAGVSADLGPMPKLTSYQPKLDELAAAGGEAMLLGCAGRAGNVMVRVGLAMHHIFA